MAVTAETRNAIIELVVTAYDAAPGTSLLTELVEAVDGGASLADVATTLTTSSTFTSTYPTFLTVEEFANELLDNLVPSASDDARAEGVAAISFVLNSGGTRADVILEAQTFLAGLDEADTTFGGEAAAFNNKVEVATFHTVTLERDGSPDGLKTVLQGVTSDDTTVDTAKTAVENSGVSGISVTLTDDIADVEGSSGDDSFKGISDSTDGTIQSGDSIDGLGGTDALNVTLDDQGIQAGTSIDNVENFFLRNVSGSSKTSSFASVDDSVAQIWNDRSTSGSTVDVTNVASLAAVGVRNSAADIKVSYLSTLLTTGTDTVNVVLDRALGGDITIATSSATAGVDAISISSGGTEANEIGTIDDEGENDFVTLTITGAQDLEIGTVGDSVETINAESEGDLEIGAVGAHLVTVDASKLGGSLDLDISGADDDNDLVITGSAQDDTFEAGDLDADDTIDGGDGADSLTVESLDETKLVSVESLTVENTATTIALDLENAADTESITIENTAAVTVFNLTNLQDGAAVTLDTDTDLTLSGPHDFQTVDAEDGVLTLNFVGNGDITLTGGIDIGDVTELTFSAESTQAMTFNNDDLLDDGANNKLEQVTFTGGGSLTISDTLISKTADEDFTVDASAVTGIVTVDGQNKIEESETDGTLTFMSGTNNDTINLTANTNKVDLSGGAGNDNLTASAFADEVDGGTGNDTISGLAGNDTITGGSGNDTITGGAGADSITPGAGIDQIVMVESASVAPSASSLSTNVAADDTLTFANGLDTVTGFGAGTGGDVLDGVDAAALPTTGIGVVTATGFNGDTFFLSGDWNSTTKVFTVKADGAGTSTLIIDAEGGAGTLGSSDDMTLLIGVDSDDLVAANFAT